MLAADVVVAADFNAASTVAGAAPGWLDRYRPPPPAVCGDAIDVPDIVVVPPPFLVERMLTPGDQMSTQSP